MYFKKIIGTFRTVFIYEKNKNIPRMCRVFHRWRKDASYPAIKGDHHLTKAYSCTRCGARMLIAQEWFDKTEPPNIGWLSLIDDNTPILIKIRYLEQKVTKKRALPVGLLQHLYITQEELEEMRKYLKEHGNRELVNEHA